MSNDKIYENFDRDWSPLSAYSRIYKIISNPNFFTNYTQYICDKKQVSTNKDFQKYIELCLLEQPNFKLSGVTKSVIKEIGRAKDIFENYVLFSDFFNLISKVNETEFKEKIENINRYNNKMTETEYAIWYADQLNIMQRYDIVNENNIGQVSSSSEPIEKE